MSLSDADRFNMYLFGPAFPRREDAGSDDQFDGLTRDDAFALAAYCSLLQARLGDWQMLTPHDLGLIAKDAVTAGRTLALELYRRGGAVKGGEFAE